MQEVEEVEEEESLLDMWSQTSAPPQVEAGVTEILRPLFHLKIILVLNSKCS